MNDEEAINLLDNLCRLAQMWRAGRKEQVVYELRKLADELDPRERQSEIADDAIGPALRELKARWDDGMERVDITVAMYSLADRIDGIVCPNIVNTETFTAKDSDVPPGYTVTRCVRDDGSESVWASARDPHDGEAIGIYYGSVDTAIEVLRRHYDFVRSSAAPSQSADPAQPRYASRIATTLPYAELVMAVVDAVRQHVPPPGYAVKRQIVGDEEWQWTTTAGLTLGPCAWKTGFQSKSAACASAWAHFEEHCK
jgi:hypothetical protein